jgi:hypothetical protein
MNGQTPTKYRDRIIDLALEAELSGRAEVEGQ